jgi:hypothetical protein
VGLGANRTLTGFVLSINIFYHAKISKIQAVLIKVPLNSDRLWGAHSVKTSK